MDVAWGARWTIARRHEVEPERPGRTPPGRRLGEHGTESEAAKLRDGGMGWAESHAKEMAGVHSWDKPSSFGGGTLTSWRIDVHRRDGYACQDCGIEDIAALSAHHLKPRRTDPHPAPGLDNGITLLAVRHTRRHLQAGGNAAPTVSAGSGGWIERVTVAVSEAPGDGCPPRVAVLPRGPDREEVRAAMRNGLSRWGDPGDVADAAGVP